MQQRQTDPARAAKSPRCCVDCDPPAPGRYSRPAPYPGPRCFSHDLAKRRERRSRAHDQRTVKVYRGVGPGDYDRIWEHQGEHCPVCLRTGRSTRRKFPLDHHHGQDWPRGIPCTPCNQYIGWIKDDPEAAKRLLEYLTNPPAWAVVGPPPEQEKPFP